MPRIRPPITVGIRTMVKHNRQPTRVKRINLTIPFTNWSKVVLNSLLKSMALPPAWGCMGSRPRLSTEGRSEVAPGHGCVLQHGEGACPSQGGDLVGSMKIQQVNSENFDKAILSDLLHTTGRDRLDRPPPLPLRS